MYTEGFPSKLKQARLKTGFTQREVAEETGITQSVLARYETGKLEPCIEVLGILADFYGVSTNWLLGTNGEKSIKATWNNKNLKVSWNSEDEEGKYEAISNIIVSSLVDGASLFKSERFYWLQEKIMNSLKEWEEELKDIKKYNE